jgi:far upstream element-binding protein
MAASQDVQAILAALQGTSTVIRAHIVEQRSSTTAAQQPTATPPNPQQPPPLPMGGMPAPVYSGVVPTPPPQQSAYPPYPQPASSGNIDLNAIKPVGHGNVNVNFQDALAKVQGFATARGIPPPSSTGMLLPSPDHFLGKC